MDLRNSITYIYYYVAVICNCILDDILIIQFQYQISEIAEKYLYSYRIWNSTQLNSTQVYCNLVVGRPNSTINHNT